MRADVEFEWDPAKADANRRRHGLSFEEVTDLFTSGVDYLEMTTSTARTRTASSPWGRSVTE
jgi:uncharacterized DUF497 family protein